MKEILKRFIVNWRQKATAQSNTKPAMFDIVKGLDKTINSSKIQIFCWHAVSFNWYHNCILKLKLHSGKSILFSVSFLWSTRIFNFLDKENINYCSILYDHFSVVGSKRSYHLPFSLLFRSSNNYSSLN